jgi:hypothetical protein
MKMMTIVQEARPGLLADITALLAENGIDVENIDGQLVGGTAVISFSVEPYHQCFDLLVDAGFRVVASEHLLVRLPDRAGALAKLSRILSEAHVDIRSIHIISKDENSSIVALETADGETARELLAEIVV